MTDRPQFLTVTYSGTGLTTMGHEKKMVREKDVKFDGEDGSLELTDIRLVWIKAPSKWGGVKKFGALAGAIAGAAVLEGIGRDVGGIGGRAIRGVGRGLAYGAVGVAVSSWTRDSFYNKDANGNTESLAVPIVSIAQASQSGDKLIIELKSGGDMRFEFKQKKVIPSIMANISSAQGEGKCPYCGTIAKGASQCPKCGAPIEGGGGGAHDHSDSVTISMSSGGGGFCTNCGQPYPEGAKFCGGCGQRV
ncbi:MAG: zinc ribbon domain-containing protein [Candidatus Thorarchaeota archaeon]|nr:zinc ribbon domain-containing protein [Candidatus Thorarchaeota archaeon]